MLEKNFYFKRKIPRGALIPFYAKNILFFEKRRFWDGSSRIIPVTVPVYRRRQGWKKWITPLEAGPGLR